MENSFQTSFIPKKPMTENPRSRSRPQTSIFTVLAFAIFIIIGIASAGLFLYKNYLVQQEKTLSTSLETVRNSFEQDTINQLDLYDKRISASKQILNNHIVLSPMFSLLGSLTIPSIQYTKFDYENNNKEFDVKMSGVAIDYKSIALQADVFNDAKGRYFKNVVFSNLTKDKNNNVNFDIDFTVDPELLSYQKDMLLEQATNSTMIPANSTNPVSNTIPANNQKQ